MPHPPIFIPVPGSKAESPRPSIATAEKRSSSSSPAMAAKPLSAGLDANDLQTLIQPDVPPIPLQQPIPVPLLLLRAMTPSSDKKIAPPPPQEHVAANVRATLDPPNREQALADIALDSTRFESKTQPVLPTTTSTVTIPDPAPKQEAPQTTSVQSTQPSSATVTSVSDLRMPNGTVVLPPVNAKAAGHPSGGLTSNKSTATHRVSESKSSESPVRESAASKPNAPATTATDSKKSEADSSAPTSGSGTGNMLSAKRILLPKDGKFNMVTVGNSMEDLYPETEGMWNGRLAYTVYLHVGLPKNWILQYSLPRVEDDAGSGSAARLDAPWPTDILIPTLPPGSSNSDAVVVHGLLDAAGHFQQLNVVFPQAWEQAKYLTETLQHWVFRPAMQNGKSASVEVLLIIPDTTD